MRIRKSVSVVVMLGLFSLPLVLGQRARCGDLRELKSVGVPIDVGYPLQTGDGQFREFLASYDLRSATEAPVLVMARNREVWYVDGGSLEIMRKNRYAYADRAIVSRNGKYVAVLSQVRDTTSRTIHPSVRVEDWQGNRLWEMDALMMGRFEPTPTGGLVIYPSLSPDEMTPGFSSDEWLVEPWPRPHPLLVYDASGNLVLEGITHEECRSMGKGVLSADGRYLAFAFAWIHPDNRTPPSRDIEDTTCVVLYDLEAAAELWRHYFDGIRPSRLAVTRGGERIVGFFRKRSSPPNGGLSMFLLGHDGNDLTENAEGAWDSMGPPKELMLSPDEHLCAFSSGGQRVHLIRMSDGSEVWSWPRPKGSLGVTCRGISNDGSAALRVGRGSWKEKQFSAELVVLNAQGQVAFELDLESEPARGGVGDAIWSEDGKSLWLMRDAAMTHYETAGLLIPTEGGDGR